MRTASIIPRRSSKCLFEKLGPTEESDMHMRLAVRQGNKFDAASVVALSKRWMMAGAIVTAATAALVAQSPEIRQKLATVKQTVAANKQRLQQYQWIETTQPTLDGDAKPQTQNLCQYGPGGQVQKTPIGTPPPPPSGGRLKQRILEKKKAEMQEYLTELKGILSQYVPPDPERMQQAYGAGNFSLNPAGSVTNFIFKDYAQPGDQMTLAFDPTKLAVVSLTYNTYMGQTKDVVNLQVQ